MGIEVCPLGLDEGIPGWTATGRRNKAVTKRGTIITEKLVTLRQPRPD
jgi:hypothetical protein